MNKPFLFLLASVFAMAFTISYSAVGPHPGYTEKDFVVIINRSEHNITWVTIIDVKTGYAVVSEKKDKLIAKGGLKSFKVDYAKVIACVKAEDVPEFICSAEFDLDGWDKTLVWGGDSADF